MNTQRRFRPEDLCFRCGKEFEVHPNPHKFGKECDNPRYRNNREMVCGCNRFSIIKTAARQRNNQDPNWNVDTHCCFCRKSVRMTNLRTKTISGWNYEQCYQCRNKTYIPDTEEILYPNKRRGRYESERERKRSKTPPEYDPINNYITKTIQENQPKGETLWQEEEQKKKEQYCTERCQFMDHKELKSGRKTYFNADTRIVHDEVNCPLGAIDYDNEGNEYPICLCYNRKARYCK